eukprot:GHVU01191853.1.p1 GENE.GHVU01191853.1~~GHVU01191853.1.p1  ORF type:complete len:178 (+),score=8.94 GHVU01191853.1:71-604(+)
METVGASRSRAAAVGSTVRRSKPAHTLVARREESGAGRTRRKPEQNTSVDHSINFDKFSISLLLSVIRLFVSSFSRRCATDAVQTMRPPCVLLAPPLLAPPLLARTLALPLPVRLYRWCARAGVLEREHTLSGHRVAATYLGGVLRKQIPLRLSAQRQDPLTFSTRESCNTRFCRRW